MGFGWNAGEEDPESAKLAEAERELAHQSHSLLSQYSASEEAAAKDDLKKQIRDVLAKQFDVQRQRREQELARVEDRLRKLRDQFRKRVDARETIIDRRLENLTSEAEGLGWGAPDGGPVFSLPGADTRPADPQPRPAPRR